MYLILAQTFVHLHSRREVIFLIMYRFHQFGLHCIHLINV